MSQPKAEAMKEATLDPQTGPISINDLPSAELRPVQWQRLWEQVKIFSKADKNTATPKPKMVVVVASSNPKGLNKNKIKVAKAQALNTEKDSATNPRVYGKGDKRLLNNCIQYPKSALKYSINC